MGPKSENYPFFKEMLGFLMDDHAQWRKDFHPDDKPAFSAREQEDPAFQETILRTRQALAELAGDLQLNSMPWFSPRYLGHMTMDTLMAANLGYMLTILYNPNNCAYEGGPATTALEIEVGRQLAALMGFDPKRAWGHITSGGTVANYEGLWLARNLKSVPRALKEAMPEAVAGLDDWALANVPVRRSLDLLEAAKAAGRFDAVRGRTARGTGLGGWKPGKVLVPQTKHYSWTKAMDVLGIGQDHLVQVRVGEDYRMDMGHLRELVEGLIQAREPILAVVAVVGSTEEGAVDPVHEVVRLRRECEERGASFYIHVDAAYGGYGRALFVGEDGRFMGLPETRKALRERRIDHAESEWPDPEVYEAFKAMSEADSITVDPHKMGYVPYAAGAVAVQDKRTVDLVSYFAAYVFEKKEENPLLLGSYILEGSKAGATVAAVWMAHKVVPLDVSGYGRLIGASIEGADHFYRSLLAAEAFEAGGRRFIVKPLVRPDFNVVDFAFNEAGGNDLDAMNSLNRRLYEAFSYKSGPVYAKDFITSKTSLDYAEYGDAPRAFVRSLGIPDAEWDRVRSVFVLRSCVLTPYLSKNTTYAEYWAGLLAALRAKLAEL
ncbi:MAG TPA: tyrosine decarboxylase [Elusimicrobia bacterium]|nr:tyrosine decarboxylase [Elusimicrobiota bacterium]